MLQLNHLVSSLINAKQHSLKYIVLKGPLSRLNQQVLNVMVREGFIKKYVSETKGDQKRQTRIFCRFGSDRKNIIKSLVYIGSNHVQSNSSIQALWKKEKGFGVFILSTSRGIMTDTDARLKNVGGKLLLAVA